MSLPWSEQQREWLQALGHPLLVLAAAGEAVAVGDSDACGLRVALASGSTAAAVSRAPDGRLQRALLQATGRRADEAEQALRELAVDASVLRADPAAKRALWPRLRRLRRERRA